MAKLILKILFLLAIILMLTAFYNRGKISRLVHTISLFDEGVIAQNFQDMEETYPTLGLTKSKKPYSFAYNKNYVPGGHFKFNDSLIDIKTYLKDTYTEGLLIIKNDTIIYEDYFLGLDETESHISWSMAKSFTATLVGIFHEKGLFELDDPIDKYLEDFKGTAYEGVSIRNLLHMSSGVTFDEDYGDFFSDINRFGRGFAMGSPIRDFAKTLKKGKKPGTFNHYVSIDTEMLAFLLVDLTGKSLTQLTQEYLWEPMGMEYDGQWIIDNDSMEMALGGLNATLRDFSKLGLCYKNDGFFNGNKIVSSDWINSSLSTDLPHLKPGENPLSSNKHGYGYQWWIPDNNHDAFAMSGIYNQYVYVDPVNDIVIVKLSANHKFKTEGRITMDMHFEMFDAIIEDIISREKIIG